MGRPNSLVALASAVLSVGSAARAQEATFSGLGDLQGGAFHSVAEGISADGSVAVGKSQADGPIHAFRWTAEGGMVSLGPLPGGNGQSQAFDASADGSVV